MRRPLLILLTLTSLAACRVSDMPMDLLQNDTCGAKGLQGLIGQPSEVLDSMRFSQPVRVVRPGMAVTVDFRADRLTVEIDDANLIRRLSCG